jgi:hypothetical protein
MQSLLAISTAQLDSYHWCFQVVYVSLLSATTQSVTFALAKTDQTRTVSTDTATVKSTCASLASCNGHGSCIVDSNKVEKCFCDGGYSGTKCEVGAFLGTDDAPTNARVVINSMWPGANSPFAESATIVIPYEVRSAPPYSKLRLRIDGKPWPDRVGSVVHVGAGGTPADGEATYFTVDVVGLRGTGIDHTFQVYLTTASGKLLDASERTFQTALSGGCAPDALGQPCSGNGLCFDGYCVCYDGKIGSDCSVTDTTQGNNLAAGETGAASYTSPGADFKPLAGFKAYKAMNTSNKIAHATTANKMGLAAVSADLAEVTAAGKVKGLSTHTKIENSLDVIANVVTTETLARNSRVAALHNKLDANAAAIAQDILSSERSKVARLEAHIDTIRALHAHHTTVTQRVDKGMAAAKAFNIAKNAEVTRALAENTFKMNQVRLMNGPPVQIDKLKKSECTTDQFYGVTCEETLDGAATGAFKQAPPPSVKDANKPMDASKTLRG